MKINTTNTTNKNKKRVAITTIICAMVVFAMVVVGCGIKKNSTVAEAEAGADVIATVGTTIDTTETVEETTETETTVEETTETTETVEEPSEEPSVETPSENTTTETPNTTPSENKPSTTETPNNTTTETPSVPSEPTHNEPTTSEPTTETPSVPTTTETPTTEEPTPNVEKCMCGTPMQMMSGYILHRAEGYYAQAIRFSNGEIFAPFNGDYNWVDEYMHTNGILSFSVADNYWVETTPEWREENVTRMCCPSCRATSEGFIAY